MQSERRTRKKKAPATAQGQILMAARQAAHLTQRELARQVKITPQHLCYLERGWTGSGTVAQPSVRLLRRVARVLGVPASSLLAD